MLQWTKLPNAKVSGTLWENVDLERALKTVDPQDIENNLKMKTVASGMAGGKEHWIGYDGVFWFVSQRISWKW
jgi:hypothetical protein